MRTSKLLNLYINSVFDSSAIICGESGNIKSKSCRINVQRDPSISKEEEVKFSEYPMFQRQTPKWMEDDEEEIIISTNNTDSIIRGGSIKILSISEGTTFQVGCNQTIDLENRLKMIKQVSSTQNKR
ncbi:spore germination protein GerPE [Paenibacillus sp. N3/727]|uniref:spore germination protein GerPE n=1 Tax=Paenibacillus sp. N3/727 TaxID=2925845 RepID=UPI001F536A45|nr:spore germination protein GerPE [Paenibacillus sp. N3/727]UNK20915.1 spore germination protein GerPE [Paenibacillus sp. N3/727]